jgi:hypothetical protein
VEGVSFQPSGADDHAVASSPPPKGSRSTGDFRATKIKAITALVVLIATFSLTLMMGLSPVLPPLVAGSFLFAVLLRGNYSWIVHAFILAMFTARTEDLSRGFRAVGFFVYFHEILLYGSLIYAIWLFRTTPTAAKRLRHSLAARAAITFSVVIAIGLTLGVIHHHVIYDIQLDARPVIDMMTVVFVVAVIVAVDDWQRYVKTITASLIFSAVLMVYASATGMPLGGRTETAELFAAGGRTLAGGSNAIRYLTDATPLALAGLLGSTALLMLGRKRVPQVMPMLIASLVISVLSFSRTTLLALAGTFVFAVLISLLNGHISQLARRLALLPLVAGVVLFAVISLGDVLGAHDWIETQATGYANRVIAGLDASNERADTSLRYREQENEYINKTGAENPILGGGFGQHYKPPTGKRGTFPAVEGQLYSHNVYNWLYVKVGLVGATAFVVLLATSIFPALFRYRRNLMMTTVAATLVGLSLAMLYSPMPIDPLGSSTIGLVIGLCIGAGALKVSRTADSPLGSRKSNVATPANP